MSYLLDSHVLLWWLEDNPRIEPTTRKTLADPNIRILVSAASIWEIGIKQALGKLRAPESVIDLLQEEGFEELAISGRHAEAAAQLPPLHRDPFDRMLVAQACLENLTLVTHDQAIQAYDVGVMMV
jgi:PIN domain nuclease of toxin-antitoxin system